VWFHPHQQHMHSGCSYSLLLGAVPAGSDVAGKQTSGGLHLSGPDNNNNNVMFVSLYWDCRQQPAPPQWLLLLLGTCDTPQTGR
jgi:hypothetical protein